MTEHTWTYYLGATKITTSNLNELRGFLEEMVPSDGRELSGAVMDLIFAVSADYQAYHRLDQDDWSIVHMD